MTPRHPLQLTRRSALRGTALTTAAAAAALLAGCGTGGGANGSSSDSGGDSGTVTVTTARGEVTVPKNPEKVAVLDLAYVDTMTELGLKDRIVALPKKYLLKDQAEQFADDAIVDTGGLKEPDFDSIAQAGPDLIIIAGRSAGLLDQLKEITPNVIDLSVDNKDFLASFQQQTKQLAAIFGKESEAEAKLAEITEQVKAVKEKASALPGTAGIFMVSGGKVTTYGPGSRFGGFLFGDLGFAPMVDSVKDAQHGDAVSFEFIAEHNPARAFILDRDAAVGQEGEAAAAVLDNPLVQKTDAFSQQKTVDLNAPLWYIYGSGLSTVREMIAQAESLAAKG